MRPDLRWLLYGVSTLALVSACDFTSPWGSSGSGSNYGTSSPAPVVGSGGAAGGTVKPGVGGERSRRTADRGEREYEAAESPRAARETRFAQANQSLRCRFSSISTIG